VQDCSGYGSDLKVDGGDNSMSFGFWVKHGEGKIQLYMIFVDQSSKKSFEFLVSATIKLLGEFDFTFIVSR
jgi:hypothetical protein